MNLKNTKPQKGFTLVEMLVVLGIIVSLATITSVLVIRSVVKGKDTETSALANDIAAISELWEDDNYEYPYPGDTGPPATDTSYALAGGIIEALDGRDADANVAQKDYLRDVKKTGQASDLGLLQTAGVNTSFADSWGNPIYIIYDYSGDQKVEADGQAHLGSYSNDEWEQTNMVILSGGRDGLLNKINDVVIKR